MFLMRWSSFVFWSANFWSRTDTSSSIREENSWRKSPNIWFLSSTYPLIDRMMGSRYVILYIDSRSVSSAFTSLLSICFKY